MKGAEILKVAIERGREQLSDFYTGGRKILENRKESYEWMWIEQERTIQRL